MYITLMLLIVLVKAFVALRGDILLSTRHDDHVGLGLGLFIRRTFMIT